MSIRVKVFFLITAIVLVITAASVFISISSAQNQILATLENDMELVVALANEYISGEIDLLKANASTVAQMLKSTKHEEVQQVLIEQVAAFEHFMAITIFNEFGRVEASYGASSAPEQVAAGEYGQSAYAGQRVVTTSHIDSSGQAVFYVLVPMEDYYYMSIIGEQDIHPRIVACTVSGDFFSSRVNRFLIWETGNITMLDQHGTVIASVYRDWVSERLNFIALAQKDSQFADAARVMGRMINSDAGTDRYVFEGVDAVIAFMPITSSIKGWSLAATAPIAESPIIKVRQIIAISGLVFLGLGMIAAAFASGFIARPFNQIKEQNAQLIVLGDAAQAASKAKSSFLANMSNEMRTPINAIIGLCELSQKKELPEEAGNSFKKIYKSGMNLMEVVNNLLDISNMESGKFDIIAAEYQVPNFINDTITINKMLIGAKPITFNLVLDENLFARVIGDELRVKQIFNNLLSNAITYTNSGTVEWKITTERDGNSVWLVSTVSDTGIGIKPEDINKLFTEYNLDIKKKQNLEGSGLGLALTKRIAGMMDGTISVESTVGKGSVFTVRIKQKFISDEVIGALTAENLKRFKYAEEKRDADTVMKYIQLPRASVLVVDDNEANLEIAKGMLASYGMQIDCAASGQEAVELVRKGEPSYSAIFMDHKMPGMDGIETCAKIREIDTVYARKVPIIALAASTIPGAEELFIGKGFQDYLAKPLEILRLDQAVRRWVAKIDVP